ncbi:hypothetical protein VNO77_46837 [Canavalia gladiata]|uniref:Transmembrane protein n=1 Tax=Canavalia gladiata TaxID=3824 RepID=A0AAN9JIL3_CANGL
MYQRESRSKKSKALGTKLSSRPLLKSLRLAIPFALSGELLQSQDVMLTKRTTLSLFYLLLSVPAFFFLAIDVDSTANGIKEKLALEEVGASHSSALSLAKDNFLTADSQAAYSRTERPFSLTPVLRLPVVSALTGKTSFKMGILRQERWQQEDEKPSPLNQVSVKFLSFLCWRRKLTGGEGGSPIGPRMLPPKRRRKRNQPRGQPEHKIANTQKEKEGHVAKPRKAVWVREQEARCVRTGEKEAVFQPSGKKTVSASRSTLSDTDPFF